MKKTKIKLDDMERRILVKLLYEKRNERIAIRISLTNGS